MEKIKSVFSKCFAWIKSHVKVVVAVVAVIVVAVVAVNLIGGPSKRAVSKYLSAISSCNDNKILKSMDVKAAVAWMSASSGEDRVKDFKEELDDVDDDDVEDYEKTIKKRYDESNKGKIKYKLKEVVYSTKAKDDKNLTKVVCKVNVTSKPDKEDDDDDDGIWKKEKQFTASADTYMEFYLYKNKVIYWSIGY